MKTVEQVMGSFLFGRDHRVYVYGKGCHTLYRGTIGAMPYYVYTQIRKSNVECIFFLDDFAAIHTDKQGEIEVDKVQP